MALTDELKKQLESKDKQVRQYAKDCLIIANKLLELSDGHIWSNDWRVLASARWVGKGLDSKRQYEPTAIGKIFIKSIINN